MVTRPELIFADEPTGNLDSKSATELLEMTRAAVDGFGQTVVDGHPRCHAPPATPTASCSSPTVASCISIRDPTMDGILDELKALGA